jgi:hypothetical protein
MIKTVNYIMGFAKATSVQIIAALNGLAGNFGYDFTQKRFFGTHDDGQNPEYFATLSDLSSITVGDASETAKGVVEVANATEYAAGNDVGLTGAPLVPKVSQIRAEMDTKVEIAEDLTNTVDAPRVQSSTTTSALFIIKNVAGTIAKAFKATATALQARLSDDTDFADFEAKAATFSGDVTIAGNLTVSGAQTQVNTQQILAEDNLITLNAGEAGAGVTAGEAGIEIDRGSLTNAELAFDESDDKFKAGIQGATKIIARGHSELVSAAAATQHVINHGLGSTNYVAQYKNNATGIELGLVTETIDADNVRVNSLVPVTDFYATVIAL